jgi:hypothetical protein
VKRGTVIKASPLACVLPLAAFSGLSNVETRPRRLLRTPCPPFAFYTPESLASIRAVPVTIDLATQATVVTTPSDFYPAGFWVTPARYFGKARSVPRAVRAAVVYESSMNQQTAGYYADEYAAAGLADLGVHLYVFSSALSAFPTNPLAAFAPLRTQTAVARTITVTGGPSAGSYPAEEQRYAAHDLAGVPGGEVYAAFVGGGAYAFGFQGVASTTLGLDTTGYVTEWSEFRVTGDVTPFATVTIGGHAQYASGSFVGPGGTTKRTFFAATEKAQADAAVLAQVAARCAAFSFSFWTLDADSDTNGTLYGDPAGIPAALGIQAVAPRKRLAGTAGARDIPTSVADIVADIAAFFS